MLSYKVMTGRNMYSYTERFDGVSENRHHWQQIKLVDDRRQQIKCDSGAY